MQPSLSSWGSDMGFIRHHAIVVTSWDEERLTKAFDMAQELGLQVIGPSPQAFNHYRSFMVCPDGSKEGWAESDAGDERRERFCTWLHAQAVIDRGTYYKWVEIAFGSDDADALITDHAWKHRED